MMEQLAKRKCGDALQELLREAYIICTILKESQGKRPTLKSIIWGKIIKSCFIFRLVKNTLFKIAFNGAKGGMWNTLMSIPEVKYFVKYISYTVLCD